MVSLAEPALTQTNASLPEVTMSLEEELSMFVGQEVHGVDSQYKITHRYTGKANWVKTASSLIVRCSIPESDTPIVKEISLGETQRPLSDQAIAQLGAMALLRPTLKVYPYTT